MTWFESPQYMKNIQKIEAMAPEDKAITQTLVDNLHGLYADQDMQKQLSSMRQATMNKRMDRGLELSESRLGLREDEFDYAKDENRTAENLGWGNIALSGLRGYADMSNRKKLGTSMDDIAKMIRNRS